MEIIISRNTTIPFEKTITLKSINNSSFNYKIYEGERKLLNIINYQENINLIIFLKKKGEEIEIEITFSMVINHNLFITVKEIGNDNKNTIKIKYNINRLDEEEEEKTIKRRKKTQRK